MTTVARRGRLIAAPRRRSTGFDRIVSAAARTEADRELARIALDVVVNAIDPMTLPPRWSTGAFGREVGAVRAQLAPILSRRSLAESFGREAAVAAVGAVAVAEGSGLPRPRPTDAVRVAYAIRWLELGDDRLRPLWEHWTGTATSGQHPLAQGNGEITT
jgi:hypothetical protein